MGCAAFRTALRSDPGKSQPANPFPSGKRPRRQKTRFLGYSHPGSWKRRKILPARDSGSPGLNSPPEKIETVNRENDRRAQQKRSSFYGSGRGRFPLKKNYASVPRVGMKIISGAGRKPSMPPRIKTNFSTRTLDRRGKMMRYTGGEGEWIKRFVSSGGEGGIRTHDGQKGHNGFRDRPIQPLWHLSGTKNYIMRITPFSQRFHRNA